MEDCLLMQPEDYVSLMESVLMDFTKMVLCQPCTASHPAAQLNVFDVLTQSTLNLSKNQILMIANMWLYYPSLTIQGRWIPQWKMCCRYWLLPGSLWSRSTQMRLKWNLRWRIGQVSIRIRSTKFILLQYSYPTYLHSSSSYSYVYSSAVHLTPIFCPLPTYLTRSKKNSLVKRLNH